MSRTGAENLNSGDTPDMMPQIKARQARNKQRLMSRRQEEFLCAWDKRVNVLTGSVRSGKTWVSLLKWALFVAGAPDGTDFLMAGNTAGTLERNCLSVLADIAGEGNFSWNRQAMRAELFGKRVWVMGAGDVSCEGKLRGMTLGGAYLDELTLLRKEFYYMLLSRLSAPGAILYATTNPDGPSHWVMEDIINNPKMDAAVWEFRLSDNLFLPKDYVKAIKDEYAGVFYERYILGLWTACEGAVYRPFAEGGGEFAVKEPGVFDIINIGVDFGGNKSAHAFVACAMGEGRGESGESGKRALYALASKRVLDSAIDTVGLFREIIAFLRFVAQKYGGRAAILNVYCDSAEPVLIRGLQAAVLEDSALPGAPDIRIRAARKRRILDRIRGTLTLMAQKRFFYTEDCETLSRALATAVWKNDVERLDDGSFDVDTLDAFEYAWERELERCLL